MINSRCRRRNLRPMGGNLEHRKGTGQTQNSGANDRNVVCKPVDSVQKGLKHLKGDIPGLRENLSPSHGHGFKLCVNIISRRKHGVLDNIGGDLPFRSHCSDLSNGNIQIIGNRLNHIGSLFKNAVQFLTAQDTGSHGLCKLKCCGFSTRRICTGNNKLFIQGFREGNQFIIVGKGITGHQAHLRNGFSRR